MIYFTTDNRKKEQGFILITTLVLLGMLTVLGVAQITINSSQTQIATNISDTETSFEKTEGAVNEAINRMLDHAYTASNFSNNNNGLYLFNQNNTPIWQTVNWDASGAVIRSFSGLNGPQASYVIEQLPSVVQPGQNMKALTRIYRITARSVGQTGNSSVLIQSTVQIQQ
ncbi:pilus assembly protein [Legionella sp. km772]|uniref:pilus assembly PilX family protein n=1 Tax=Legionella sp. km772 TaxID=2498111 RepID=UPI000F8CE65E|nr:pilus assembly protein [Legionella sp. km772]RUR06004.1 pilus assembly protein [Legionella sp. km772]